MEVFINQFGYAAVAALIFLEVVFPPIPSEVILPLSGFLTITSAMTLPGVVAASTAGSLAGAFVFYGVGHVLNRDRLAAFFDTKFMRLLGFTSADVIRVVDWFERKGQVTVLLCRFVPGIRSLISIPAGTARMNLGLFALLTAIGSAIWNAVLCGLGAAAGGAWQQVADQVGWVTDVAKFVLLGVLAVAAIWWIVCRALPVWREQA